MGLTLKDRTIIAKRWADGDSAAAIAEGLGFAPGTIYAELVRGHTGEKNRPNRLSIDTDAKTGESHATIAGTIPQILFMTTCRRYKPAFRQSPSVLNNRQK